MGIYEMLFGNLPPPPRHPSSRGALLGARYQGMPDSPNIDDQRQAQPDYAWQMQNPSVGDVGGYLPSNFDRSANRLGFDPMLYAAPLLDSSQPSDVAPYTPSFRPNWKPPYTRQAPYRRFERPLDDPIDQATFGSELMGPNLPHPPLAFPTPMAPGDPRWTSPPSPSGPHNRGGDPPRPGYDAPGYPNNFGLTLNSMPQLLALLRRNDSND